MFDINGWEVIVLAIVAVIVLGPERLPVYAAKLARAVRQLKTLADGARAQLKDCLLYTFDAADERTSVDLGGRRFIKKKNTLHRHCTCHKLLCCDRYTD